MSGRRDAVLAPAGISQSTTAPWTIAQDVRAYREAGASTIGIWLHKLERETMDEFWFPEEILDRATVDGAAALVRDAGLPVSHVVFAGRFTEDDEELRARRLAHAVFAAEAASSLDAACLVVIPGRLNGLPQQRAFELAVASLTELLERTEASGVRLAVEPVTEVDFCATLSEALALVDAVNHPRLGVFPDSFHLLRDPGILADLERAGDRIFGVHLADGSGEAGDRRRVPPGEGALPLVEFVRAIDAAGYTGSYDVELFGIGLSGADVSDLLSRSLAGLATLLEEALPDPAATRG